MLKLSDGAVACDEEDDRTCSICLDKRADILLPCLHAFCNACIQGGRLFCLRAHSCELTCMQNGHAAQPTLIARAVGRPSATWRATAGLFSKSRLSMAGCCGMKLFDAARKWRQTKRRHNSAARQRVGGVLRLCTLCDTAARGGGSAAHMLEGDGDGDGVAVPFTFAEDLKLCITLVHRGGIEARGSAAWFRATLVPPPPELARHSLEALMRRYLALKDELLDALARTHRESREDVS